MSKMINDIIDGISIALNTEFGDEYETYTEEIKQGLTEPCFFISCLQPGMNQFLGKQYQNIIPICIQFFPESEKKQRECNDVAERMYRCLENITTVGDDMPVRGTKMKHLITDGVLSFFVNYNFFTHRREDVTPMNIITLNTNVRGGD